MTYPIQDLLCAMVAQGASDLHLKVGMPPGLRVDGEMIQMPGYPPLSPVDTSHLAAQLMTEEQRARFDATQDIDFSYTMKTVSRFRVNALVQRGSIGIVVRVIPNHVPTAAELDLPQICLDLVLKPRGLVVVTGRTGSGKTTTLAAMTDHVNENMAGHIITMEDPLEFMHQDKQCYVTQREIGTDCESFHQALRRALRQDPDVILVGEMRDLETISMAITAAETGHLVIGTLHTTSAISTVDRIIDVFPTDSQQQVRVQLSGTLQGVISQCLVPKIGGGRVAAREMLIATDAVRSLVREGKTSQMLNLMQTGKQHSMTTLEAELIELVNLGQITEESAIAEANRPEDVRRGLQATTRTPVTASMDPHAAYTSGVHTAAERPRYRR